MKKVLGVILAVALVFNFGVFTANAADADAIATISAVTANPGEKVDVYIGIEGVGGIKTLTFFDFSYDDTVLTIVEDECAWLIYGKIKDIDFENNASIITFDDNTAYSGNILKLVFQVSEDAEVGKYPISCKAKGTRMVNETETEITVSNANGVIYIGAQETDKAVSGEVTSFLSETDVVTLILTSVENSEVSYSAEVTGNSAEYSFENVQAGEYVLTVSKDDHVTRTYGITVADENVAQDVKIHILGDINGDGKVNTIDVARANAHARSVSYLTGYELSCVDVNGDGKANTIDVARMNAHARGVTTLW